MIGAMQGGMFLYLYRVSDPTSILTSAARLTHGFGVELVLRQPANSLLVIDYTLTAVTGRGRSGSIDVDCTARDYTDESVITTASIRMPSVSTPLDPLTFGVDGILPNASHHVFGVPSPAGDRWVTVSLEVPSACAVFLSAVTVHAA
jgi:hypothetical protein